MKFKVTHFKILLLADPFTDMKACTERAKYTSTAAKAEVIPNSLGSLSKYNTGTKVC